MLLIVLLIFSLSVFLFYKAAGTLNPGKLNIVSYTFFIFMLQSFFGTALLSLGFDGHYTFVYLLDKEKSTEMTVAVVFGIAVLLPLFILFFEKIFRTDVKSAYSSFLKRSIQVKKDRLFFFCFCIAAAVSLLILAGFLTKIGYVPFFRLFFAPDGFDYSVERARISELYFLHPYITNIGMLMALPLLSYISFSYFISEKGRKWMIVSGVLFIAGIIVKTYKFEKSQLIFHLLIYVLIYLYYRGGIRLRYMVLLGGALGCMIVGFYFATGFQGSIADIYNGPIGRVLFTEVGTLAYCFDLFPQVFSFLGGRSFTPTILNLLGMDSSLHLRSSELTMAFYGSEKVYDGTAGVMNTLFAGEAYANWGWVGIAVSVVWVALVISAAICIVLKMKKTPGTIVLAAVLSVKLGAMLEGGFCDFVYNFDMIFTVICLLFIYFAFESDGRINRFVQKIGEKAEKMTGRKHGNNTGRV